MLLRNSNAVFAQADEARQLAKEHGLITIAPLLGFWRGWALVQMGQAVEGLSEIHLWLSASTQTVAEIGLPWIFCWLGESYLIAGRAQEGRQAIAEGLTAVQSSDAGFIEAELRRLKGELLLIGDNGSEPEAAQSFREAIEVARGQSAKSWELRATISLARLLDKQGHRDEARTMLGEIYNWFTEGFGTTDLIDAKKLLDELAG